MIPYDRNWDRYDVLDGSSNWNAGFARGAVAGSNNGMTLNQILGYRAILLSTGDYGGGAMEETDYQLFDQWLISPLCNSNVNRQVFVFNGDKVGEVLRTPWSLGYGLSFLNNTLAATLFCDAFNGVSSDPDCAPPTTELLRALAPDGRFVPDPDRRGCVRQLVPEPLRVQRLRLAGWHGQPVYLTEEGDKSRSTGRSRTPTSLRTIARCSTV